MSEPHHLKKNDIYLRDYLNERTRVITSIHKYVQKLFDLPISYERSIIQFHFKHPLYFN